MVALFVALGGTAFAVRINTIGQEELKVNSVGQPELRLNSVGGPEIINGAIDTEEIANGAITKPKFSNAALAAIADALLKFDSGTITQEDLANGSVDTGEIVDSAITSADINDDTITGFDVLNESLTAADIADGVLTANEIAPRSLNGGLFALDSLGADAIGDGLGLSEIDQSAVQSRVSGSCVPGQAIRSVDQSGSVICQAAGGGGGPPSGPASGDLIGMYPAPRIGTLPAAGYASEPIIMQPGVPAVLELDPFFQFEDAMWDSGNPTRITINRTGVYQVNFQATGSNMSAVIPPELVLHLSFLLNGGSAVDHLSLLEVIREGSGVTEIAHGGGLVYLQEGQYLEVQGQLDGGAGAPTYVGSTVEATVQLHWLSEGQLP